MSEKEDSSIKQSSSEETSSTPTAVNIDNPNKPFQTYHQVKRESAHR
jgi:hypothetical protein